MIKTDWWDRYYLSLALKNAAKSNDPNTRVGAVFVPSDSSFYLDGWNRFPPGIEETPERLHDRDFKLQATVHAEIAACIQAARSGIKTVGGTIYLAATDDSGLVWGGEPCPPCLKELLEFGIARIFSFPVKPIPSKWHVPLAFSRERIIESGIAYQEFTLADLEGVGCSR